MAGRPPSTVEGEIRAQIRRLKGVHGAMDPESRLAAMSALMANVAAAYRYHHPSDRTSLVRLAAHATAWAEEMDER